jgi:signal transduction histidine kinase
MSDVLDNAIRHSEGGRVLVAAGRHGGRVQIAVLDDGAAVERAEQEAHLRGAERLLALQGGTIEVSVRPGAGSTVVIRLPEPAAARPTQAAPAAPAAAPPPAAMTRKPALRATVAQADQ